MSHTPDVNPIPSKGQAGADPYSIPLDRIDVSDSELFETDTHWGYFERLRKEDPVHYCAAERVRSVLVGHEVRRTSSTWRSTPRSSPRRAASWWGIPNPTSRWRPGFITMDGPRHDAHRKVVQPVAAPRNLVFLEPLIRERVGRDPRRASRRRDLRLGRPRVDRAHHRHAGAPCSTSPTSSGASSRSGRTWRPPARSWSAPRASTEEERRAALMECLEVFTALWKEREGTPPTERLDFVTALANAEATRGLEPARVSRNADPADRGRQRHDAELHLGRRRGVEREPGRVSEAARRPGVSSRTW